MERKKQSKGSGWECCYANKIFGTFGVEMRAYGQKLVKFCTLTHAAKLVVEMLPENSDPKQLKCYKIPKIDKSEKTAQNI